MARSGNHTVLALITGPLLFALYACGSILGITDGTPREDGGTVDAPVVEATTGDEKPVTADASTDGATEACVSKDVCVDHCGVTLDECGITVRCRNECGEGKQCNAATHVCECSSDPNWCTGRCGKTKDNCQKDVTCGGCPGAQACDLTTNSCGGCVPDNNTACLGKNCGFAQNNCGQTTSCGLCAGAGQCNSGTCCTANPVCSGKTCGRFDNGCNQTVECGGNGGQCPPGGTCNATSNCCFDDGTACDGRGCGAATNNCGAQVQCKFTCAASEVCGTNKDPNACCTSSCNGKQCSENNGCAGGSSCSGIACTSSLECCTTETCTNDFGSGQCKPGACIGPLRSCSGTNNSCCYPLNCVLSDGGVFVFDAGPIEGGSFTYTCQP